MVRGPTGSSAEVLDPLVDDTGLTVVNISNTGSEQTFSTSARKYVLTEDITSTGTALNFWTDANNGINGIVVDLNGHTVTYNTSSGIATFGIRTGRSYNVRITNGTVVQGGTGEASHAVKFGINTEVDNLVVRVSGEGCHGIYQKIDTRDFAADTGGRIHDCFIVNDNGTTYDATYGDIYECAINLTDGDAIECYNNVICGGHNGIYATYTSQSAAYTAAHHIHHNRFFYQTRRIGGKSPSAIQLYGVSGCEVDENWITTWDARGLIVQLEAASNNIHHNAIDVRYTTTASGDGYPENHLYAYWQRRGINNYCSNNIMIGVNYTDAASDTATDIIELGGGTPTPTVLDGCQYNDNFMWAKTNVASYVAKGFAADDVGDTSTANSNTIMADDLAFHIQSACEAFEIASNTLINMGGSWDDFTIDSPANPNDHDNTTESFTENETPPAAVTGISATAYGTDTLVAWTKNTEADVFQYNVYRNGTLLNTYPVGVTFYVDLGSTGATYTVKAVNTTGTLGVGASSDGASTSLVPVQKVKPVSKRRSA